MIRVVHTRSQLVGGKTRETVFVALEVAAKNAIPVSVACVIAGVMFGVIGLTGLRLEFSR